MSKIIQISDLHLMADAQQRYRGVDVEGQFIGILEHIQQNHGDATLLCQTGDLVHQGGAKVYQRIAARMEEMAIKWCWIPGNHDELPLMEHCWGERLRQIQIDDWLISLLDSTDCPDGKGSGSLYQSELQFLNDQLQRPFNHLVVLHHNPVLTKSFWQNQISLGNREKFLQIVNDSPGSGAVLFGHLHQDLDRVEGRWRYLCCPSTAVQFRPNCAQFEIEDDGFEALPGYRWIELKQHGCLDTGIERCDVGQ